MPNTLLAIPIAAFLLVAQPEELRGLRPVEQGFEDVSPLASGSEVQPIDLRMPFGFERVYEFTAPDGSTRFARIDNGIVATFDRSDYIPGEEGAFIPPNTRFHIGTRDYLSEFVPQYKITEASGRIDRRVDTRAAEPFRTRRVPPSSSPEQQEAVTVPGPPAIVTNEIYRRVRIAQLLSDAIQHD